MCVKPTTVHVPQANGYKPIQVPCRHCWACLKNAQDDLVGRCLLEKQYSDYVRVLTLTYDDKRLITPHRAKQIFKEDFQKFMYRMRTPRQRYFGNYPYNIRYIAAGEYGSKKGRAHFHVCLFGKGQPPDVSLKKNYQYLHEWPHGYTYADDASSEKAIRYVAKYLVKQKAEISAQKRDAVTQEWFTFSKNPCLGAEGVYNLALRQAEMGLMPYNLRYTPNGARPGSQYSLRGKAEEIYFDTLLSNLPGAATLPCNEWVENARSRYLKKLHVREWDELAKNYSNHVQTYYETQGITKDRFVQRYLTDGILSEDIRTSAAVSRAENRLKGFKKWLVANGETAETLLQADHWKTE